MQAGRGGVDVTIISAQPLQKAQLEAVTKAATKIAGQGKTVNLQTSVDPNILGGLQVLVGDRFLDLSVSSRIHTLTQTLDSAV